MTFHIMTLFPDYVDNILSESIIGRARKEGRIAVETVNIRDYAPDKYGHVDDKPFGGGEGMVICPGPVYDCYADIVSKSGKKPYTIYMSPSGSVFNESKAMSLREYDDIVIICGHYEGVDQRVIDEICDEEISIGDYILTGGELAACVLVDSVSRLVPGVLASEESYMNESHTHGLLEPPQYSGPREFHGMSVPSVLISGNHKEIELWKASKSLEVTKKKRHDLI